MAKVKVPKKVAGVKIPKKVRKKANKALKIAESPMAREVAVAALGAAGVGKAAKEATGSRPLRDLDVETVLEAAREAALNGIRAFLEGLEDGLRKAAETAEDAAETVDEQPTTSSKGRSTSRTRSG